MLEREMMIRGYWEIPFEKMRLKTFGIRGAEEEKDEELIFSLHPAKVRAAAPLRRRERIFFAFIQRTSIFRDQIFPTIQYGVSSMSSESFVKNINHDLQAVEHPQKCIMNAALSLYKSGSKVEDR